MTTRPKSPPLPFGPTDVAAIYAGRNGGKTYLAAKYVQELRRKNPALRVVSIDPVGTGGFTTGREVAAALAAGDKLVSLTTSNAAECLAALYLAYLASTPASPVFILCDEAPLYLDRTTDGLNKIMFQGRHKGVGMLILSQRPVAVAAAIRSQCVVTLWGRLTDARDMQTAAAQIGKARADTLPRAAQGQFIQHPPALK